VRRPDVNTSNAHADLEPGPDGRPAVRLGIGQVRTIGDELATQLVGARQEQPGQRFADLDELTRAVTLTSAQAEALATAGALDSLTAPAEETAGGAVAGGSGRPTVRDRRAALWGAGAAAGERAGSLPGTMLGLEAPALPGMSEVELTVADIWATGISPESYPTEYVRDQLQGFGVRRAADLAAVEHGTRVLVAGMVTHRQRPATASGVIFINLEDESGMLNVICSVGMWKRYRTVARGAAALLIRGVVERDGGSISIVADRIAALRLPAETPSRDFR
jgi:error-prone DNA polymerase